MLDVLNSIEGDNVNFEFFGEDSSCIIKEQNSENDVYVIMPMRLWWLYKASFKKFRLFNDELFRFNEGVNLILGKNGSGKTFGIYRDTF